MSASSAQSFFIYMLLPNVMGNKLLVGLIPRYVNVALRPKLSTAPTLRESAGLIAGFDLSVAFGALPHIQFIGGALYSLEKHERRD
jgi:hypothetical protein